MKGSYALVLHLAQATEITVGKLGTHLFNPGHYFYSGSALNSLEGRIRRHFQPEKKLHWHIDYLLAEASIQQVWWSVGLNRQECEWTQAALTSPGITTPIRGFGASDCRKCPSHLSYAATLENVDFLARTLVLNKPKTVQISYPDFKDVPGIDAGMFL